MLGAVADVRIMSEPMRKKADSGVDTMQRTHAHTYQWST